ncbi:trk system potassium uptake protein TrkH [Geothermobacter ehrlichii]|uniref:Trk system potassium uptake protein TrkH n=1 Tax=Geothermobacter ehrlichii TaxID=213224 RepID=A0A5D3WJ04_9BACT|nr:TrkH family potassium uptake protein [Geothermobacter ehrlichii]TYO98480.1 trk system potassium uptake protein TrkH [Geothermobacter ehrlichii]
MNVRLTLRLLGALLIFLAGTLLFPVPFSLYFGDGATAALLLSALLSAVAGATLFFLFRTENELSLREGFAVVSFSWILFSAFGALPFLFSGTISNPIDAVFETMSGFTTTGATILTRIEGLPESILLWRALTHWLGGMGIIVLSLAILPMLGVGGMQLFKAEVPGPTADRLKPRIQDTAKLLWGVYVLLTMVETLLLMLGGMNFYEALCHAFATLATGGFSTRNASVGAFDSSYIDWIITLFMFLAGVNFSLHYHALRGRWRDFWKNEEFRCYLGITLAATLLLVIANQGRIYGSLIDNLRYSAFQATSILTTTGFGTADYEQWPVIAQYLLAFLMFIGGCAGSTGGGIKVLRILLLFKHAHVQIFRLIHPRAVRLVKLGNVPVNRDVMQSILGFFALYIGIFVIASFIMAGTGLDLVSAGMSVAATLGNIGPGLGSVGPVDNYAHIAPFGKAVLILCMLLGRLEIFTVLVLLFPTFWRK